MAGTVRLAGQQAILVVAARLMGWLSRGCDAELLQLQLGSAGFVISMGKLLKRNEEHLNKYLVDTHWASCDWIFGRQQHCRNGQSAPLWSIQFHCAPLLLLAGQTEPVRPTANGQVQLLANALVATTTTVGSISIRSRPSSGRSC